MVILIKQLDGLLVKKQKRKQEQNKNNSIKHFVDVTILVLIVTGKLLNTFRGILNTNSMILMGRICPEVCFFFSSFDMTILFDFSLIF